MALRFFTDDGELSPTVSAVLLILAIIIFATLIGAVILSQEGPGGTNATDSAFGEAYNTDDTVSSEFATQSPTVQSLAGRLSSPSMKSTIWAPLASNLS